MTQNPGNSTDVIFVDLIAGARPNFMKIGPIIRAIESSNQTGAVPNIQYRLIHTGQHYDQKMSGDFFDQLNIPKPHLNLGVGSGTHAIQTGRIMKEYEAILSEGKKPDLCIVVGDVNSTMACALVAKKKGVKLAHVEGGLRSRNMEMPEEINRMVTDSISDFFFTTSREANDILRQEGHSDHKLFFVGNTMIDSLYQHLDQLIQPDIFKSNELNSGQYLLMTLHRPANVDDVDKLESILTTVHEASSPIRIVFPMHPRTQAIYRQLKPSFPRMIIADPMPYLQFIYLVKHAKGVITDSGGLTEETTVLGIPCLTLRKTTERPETVTIGTNEVIGQDIEVIQAYVHQMVKGDWKKGGIPDKWDGKTGKRIIEILRSLPLKTTES